MSVATDVPTDPSMFGADGASQPIGKRVHRVLAAIPTWVLWMVVIVWTVPTLGLLISSFRPASQIAGPASTGWWEAVLPQNWGDLTLENYDEILFASSSSRLSMWEYFLNTLAIVLPATVIPIAVAAFAAYGFAWMDFKGRNWLFIAVIAMIVVIAVAGNLERVVDVEIGLVDVTVQNVPGRLVEIELGVVVGIDHHLIADLFGDGRVGIFTQFNLERTQIVTGVRSVVVVGSY